jgi:hypothetical protein
MPINTDFPSFTGTKSFCAANDGVIRNNTAGTLTASASYAGCLGFTPMQN